MKVRGTTGTGDGAAQPEVVDLATLEAGGAIDAQRLVSSFLSRQREATGRAYVKAFGDFQRFAGAPNVAAALADVLSSRGRGHELADDYLAHLRGRGLSGNTINQRLAALRSFVETARRRDIVDWKLEVDAERVEILRDTRGPGVEGVRRIFAAITGDTPMDRRNRAMIRLLYDLGLRREEVCRLDLADFDAEGNRLWVLGKGRGGKEALTLGAPTRAAIQAWVDVRGREASALFWNFDPTRKGPRRITGTSLYRILVAVAEKAGFPREEHKASPHKMRHAAITELLNRNNGNVRATQKFSRHKKLDMVAIYDDARQDVQGEMVALLMDDDPPAGTPAAPR